MDRWSDRLPAHADGSLPRQRWSQSNSSDSSPAVETAGPSQPPNVRPNADLVRDDPVRAFRTTALRQLNGNPKPFSRQPRQSNPAATRSSALASQPVLVRSYSGPTDETAANINNNNSNMPSRRAFPFRGSWRNQPRCPELPSEEDFSIENILRAIEPDIRSTLESIAEICGRSRLSLANEYGSHIAPLGEIRAPPGGLVTVEEASPMDERQHGDHVVIYDDDASFMEGRDHTSPYYSYLENLRREATAQNAGYQSTTQPETPRSVVTNPMLEQIESPMTREFTSSQKSGCRALLGNHEATANDSQGIVTPAVVSEVHLDARANESSSRIDSNRGQSCWGSSHPASTPPERGRGRPPAQIERPSVLADLQALFNWLRQASRAWSGADQQLQTAEMRLRMMLEQQASRNISQEG